MMVDVSFLRFRWFYLDDCWLDPLVGARIVFVHVILHDDIPLIIGGRCCVPSSIFNHYIFTMIDGYTQITSYP